MFHCPFCHGWEVRGRPLGVLDNPTTGEHRALLLTAWSDDVTLYTGGPEAADDDGAASIEKLGAAGVRVEEREVIGLAGPGRHLEAIRFRDGTKSRCEGLLVPVTLHQRSDVATRLGGRLVEAGPLTAEAVDANEVGATSVPGLYVAGDANGRMPSVANAVASGSNAAAAIVGRLTGAIPSH